MARCLVLFKLRPHLLQENPCWRSSDDSNCVAPLNQVLAHLYGACRVAQTVPSAVVCNGQRINCCGCSNSLRPRTCILHAFKLVLLRPCAGTRELQASASPAPPVSCQVVSTVPHAVKRLTTRMAKRLADSTSSPTLDCSRHAHRGQGGWLWLQRGDLRAFLCKPCSALVATSDAWAVTRILLPYVGSAFASICW